MVNSVYLFYEYSIGVFSNVVELLSEDHPPSKTDYQSWNRTRPEFLRSRPRIPDRKMHLIFTLEDRKRRQTRDKLFVPNLSIPSDQRSLELFLVILRKPKNIETKRNQDDALDRPQDIKKNKKRCTVSYKSL